MTNGMANFRPVKLSAKPPDNGDGQKAKRCKFEIFPRVGFQGLVILLTSQEHKPQDIGPSWKATTFSACRARKSTINDPCSYVAGL